ncbi:hypothetical protein C8Q80DRAFT_913188 [Daedaleopsis nitida]|nr:hypothetical protein C8Q80DRAFT_913188 [Daedaleopsis nitida]
MTTTLWHDHTIRPVWRLAHLAHLRCTDSLPPSTSAIPACVSADGNTRRGKSRVDPPAQAHAQGLRGLNRMIYPGEDESCFRLSVSKYAVPSRDDRSATVSLASLVRQHDANRDEREAHAGRERTTWKQPGVVCRTGNLTRADVRNARLPFLAAKVRGPWDRRPSLIMKSQCT